MRLQSTGARLPIRSLGQDLRFLREVQGQVLLCTGYQLGHARGSRTVLRSDASVRDWYVFAIFLFKIHLIFIFVT